MATKKRSKKKSDGNIFTFIICILGIALLVMCIVLISRSCSGNPAPSASSSATYAPSTQTAPTYSPNPSLTPSDWATATSDNSSAPSATAPSPSETASASASVTATATATPTPAPSTPPPIKLNENQVMALHVTVDTGYEKPGNNEMFDEFFSLSNEYVLTMDPSTIKMVLFITDYRGNYTVRLYENLSATYPFSKFTFIDGSKQMEDANSLNIKYDSAGTAKITWAGQSVSARIDGEASAPYELSYTSGGKTVKLHITNLGILEKDNVF